MAVKVIRPKQVASLAHVVSSHQQYFYKQYLCILAQYSCVRLWSQRVRVHVDPIVRSSLVIALLCCSVPFESRLVDPIVQYSFVGMLLSSIHLLFLVCGVKG